MATSRSGSVGSQLVSQYQDIDRAGIALPAMIVKRDGRVVPFDVGRIERAMGRCFASLERTPHTPIAELARRTVNIIAAQANGALPTVEGVQDIVEMVLQAAGEFEAAKHYILYRAEQARKRAARPVPDEVRRAFDASDTYFPTALQKFQFFDKYSRFNYELGRRETWLETVDRSVDFLYELAGARLPAATYQRIRHAILDLRAMPSMRLLAMAGPAARRSHIAIYNCSYQPVESIDSFVEALIISMSGCGVGYSVESRYVENFPRIKRQHGAPPTTFVVEDSAEGWAEGLRFGLETWFEGGDVRFDLSLLRPAGAPLRTKGGRASGPEPLRLMLQFLRSRILARQGSFLRPIDAHDMMCAVGNAAVSGGVRRTAMLALFDYDDSEMWQCKSGDFERENSQRWNANNSAVWPEGGLTQLDFARNFLEMVESGRGEPGIFNREAANQMRPERREAAAFGTNPCVTGDTWVAVADGRGRVQMHELAAAGQDIPVFTVKDGALTIRMMRHPRKTGTATPLYRVAFADGTFIRVTPNHRVILTDGTEKAAIDLQPNDALVSLTVSSYQTEGLPRPATVTYDAPGSYRMLQMGDYKEPEQHCIARHQPHPRSQHAAAEALAEAHTVTDLPVVWRNGHTAVIRTCEVCGTPFEVPLSRREQAVCSAACSMQLAHPAHAVPRQQLRQQQTAIYNDLLVELGRHPTRHEWQTRCQAAQISAEISRASSAFRSWHAVQTHASLVNHRVVAIEPDGWADVFTGTVDETHTFFAIGAARFDQAGRALMGYILNRQCGEIVLRPWEFCNLTAAVARSDDTVASLRDKVEVATIIGTIQAMATHFPGLRPMWQQNCAAERLLGVDITGQLDSPLAQDAEVKDRLRQVAIETNRETAQALGINQAASITCVKPSGNSSQMLNCASGLHARWAPYYIRNIRVAATSPLFRVLHDAGVPMDPENGQTAESANTWVIHFPIKSPDGATTRNDRSAVEQCNFWLQNKLHWTEHNPSCFTQETRFITNQGLRRFDAFGDGETVLVLNHLGRWTEGVVRHFGEQEVWEVVVERTRVWQTIRTTANHLWPTTSPMRRFRNTPVRFLRTDELACIAGSPDYQLITVNPCEPVEMDLEGVVHGEIVAVQPTRRYEPVACVQVPDGEQFVLEGNILTHNCTITYRPHEIIDLMKWVWEHRDVIGGMAFLPAFDANYAQMPYVEITREEYEQLAAAFPPIDFSKVYRYEDKDLTNAAQELACGAGACEVDI